jgi:hypothetical protein
MLNSFTSIEVIDQLQLDFPVLNHLGRVLRNSRASPLGVKLVLRRFDLREAIPAA